MASLWLVAQAQGARARGWGEQVTPPNCYVSYLCAHVGCFHTALYGCRAAETSCTMRDPNDAARPTPA